MKKVQSYACGLRGEPHETTVCATSIGKAKSMYLDEVRDCLPDVRFTDVRARSLGGPVTDDRFRRTAEYRGVPFARVGMHVRVAGEPGVIVGCNSSANFNVLFDEASRYKGATLNCHPHWEIVYFDDDGRELRLSEQDRPGPSVRGLALQVAEQAAVGRDPAAAGRAAADGRFRAPRAFER